MQKELKNNIELLENFTTSIFYEIELTSRYFKFLANQVFEKAKIEISPEEFAALDILTYMSELCQRDLAKILLKDRANTGKILGKLEKLDLIKRIADTKGNRLVRKICVTDKGREYAKEINLKFKELKKITEDKSFIKDKEQVRKLLCHIRNYLKNNIETKI